MGTHARRPRLPEVIVLSFSSDSEYMSDSSSDRAPLIFRRTRQRDVIVLNDNESDICASHRRAPCIVDVGSCRGGFH